MERSQADDGDMEVTANISATRNGDLLQSVTPSRVGFPEAEGYRISQPRRFGS